MFGLFSKSKTEKFDFSLLGTDMHSHLLPGIDDGAGTVEAAVELIKGMKGLGYRKLITTPHIIWDMYRNTTSVIQRQLEVMRNAVTKEGLDIELHAAAEYFLDDHVEELLQKKEPLLTISGNKVLVEFSLAFPPMNIKSVLFEMQMQGYQPVIAHPERYIYLQGNKEFYDELRDAGCLFQLNLMALTGHYGRSVMELSHYLSKNDFYSLVGTDLHHAGHLEELSNPKLAAAMNKFLDTGKLLNAQL